MGYKNARERLRDAVNARLGEMPQVAVSMDGLALSMRSAVGAEQGEYLPRMTETEAAELSRTLGIEPLRHMGHNMWAVVTVVTPAMATRWLDSNNGTNRIPKPAHAGRLQRDIAAGRWFLTHEAIAFRADGQLQDGQHRLFAIQEAGHPVLLAIIANVTDEAQMVIDTGASRSAIDYLRFRTGEDLPALLEQAVRLAYKETHGKEWSNPELGEALLKFYPAFNWAYRLFPPRAPGVRNHAVIAALACAVHHVDLAQLERLEQFAKVLCTGASVNPGTDQAAIALGNQLRTAQKTSRLKSNASFRFEVVCHGIQMFLAGESAQTIRAKEGVSYHLPDEAPDYDSLLEGRLAIGKEAKTEAEAEA